jgi:transposase-like protein
MSERKKLKMVETGESGMAAELARAGGASASSAAAPIAAPDVEVRAVARRRSFTAAYKLAVLEEADRCASPGAIGALLRREGLYSSHLTMWRREREAGALEALGRRRGRKAKMGPEARRVAQLEAKNARLERELEQARLIIEVQKKLCTLLGLPTAAHDDSAGSES